MNVLRWLRAVASAVVMSSALAPPALAAAANAPTTAAEIVNSPAGTAGKLFYVDEGPKSSTLPPVIFVHSFAGSSNHWDAQIAHLRRERRVIALDLRGHGKSQAPANAGSGAYSVDAFASDIGAVADQLMIKRFVLVGHSLGAAAAADYAAKHPSRVESLVLVGAPGRTPSAQSERLVAAMRLNYDEMNERFWKSLLRGARPETEAALRQESKRVPRESALSIIQSVFAFDPVPAINAYPGPKLIIDTTHGDNSNALYRQVPEVPRKVIAGTSHWPQLDKPDEFNQVLDRFL